MLCIEVKKSNKAFIDDLKKEFADSITSEVNSFGSDSIVQIIIPLAAILAPVIAPIIMKALTDRTITVKYDGIEISGDHKRVKTMIEEIESKRKARDGDK